MGTIDTSNNTEENKIQSESCEEWTQPKLPDEYTLEDITKHFDRCKEHRDPKVGMWNMISDYYHGEFWKEIKAKLPSYQVLPDTNYVRHTVDNITNSVYTTAYRADLLPRHYRDNDLALHINSFLEHIWDVSDIKQHLTKCGKRATMFNLAAIQVGWDDTIIGISRGKTDKDKDERYKGEVMFKYIDVGSLYLDPSTPYYMKGRGMHVADELTLFDLMAEPKLKEGAKAYLEKLRKGYGTHEEPDPEESGQIFTNAEGALTLDESMRVDVTESYWKVDTENGYRIDKITYINKEFVLDVQKGIEPNTFPIRILYSEIPEEDPYGIPLTRTVLQNNITINMIDSLEATHAYRSQNRTKLINSKSGINYRSFAKYGNTPGMAFPVHGNPQDVVRYVEEQELPNMSDLRARLDRSTNYINTGIDERYTGRDTGSIQTTGGTDLAQQRLSSTDNMRIVALEEFAKELTELTLEFYIKYGKKRKVYKKKPGSVELKEEEIEIDFESLDKGMFNFSINATPHLPRNKVRLGEAATMLMQMQGQYNFQPALITEEEWLMFQDIPQRDLILQRMRAERLGIDTDRITANLLNFAAMVNEGMDPQDAINLMAEEDQFLRDNPGLAAGGPGPGIPGAGAAMPGGMQPPGPDMGMMGAAGAEPPMPIPGMDPVSMPGIDI